MFEILPADSKQDVLNKTLDHIKANYKPIGSFAPSHPTGRFGLSPETFENRQFQADALDRAYGNRYE